MTTEFSLDRFERAREAIWNLPGFQVRRSTITSAGTTFFPGATWVIETVRTEEQCAIFIQKIDKEGGQRIVVPDKVAKAIYRHYDQIMKTARSERAKKAAETRKRKE